MNLKGTLWRCSLRNVAAAKPIYVEICGTYLGGFDADKIAKREFSALGFENPSVEMEIVEENELPDDARIIRGEWKGSDYASNSEAGPRRLEETVFLYRRAS